MGVLLVENRGKSSILIKAAQMQAYCPSPVAVPGRCFPGLGSLASPDSGTRELSPLVQQLLSCWHEGSRCLHLTQCQPSSGHPQISGVQTLARLHLFLDISRLPSIWRTDWGEHLSLILSTGTYNCLAWEREINSFGNGWKGNHIQVTVSPESPVKYPFKMNLV